MSLDKNLFTLFFTPHKDNQNVIDLVDPSGTVHYRKQRVPTSEYKIEVYDPMSESLLATATAPAATNKIKTIELYNPTSVVELKFTGTLSFRWSFKWEENEFEWKREECFMIRKPDPPVIIAVTKEPAGRLKTTSVQILDYNLNRFDIDDRKGLEIVVLTALMTFQDANEAHHTPEASASTSNPIARAASSLVKSPLSPPNDGPPPPPPPPKPAPRTGLERIAELQANQGEYNEIVVSGEGSVPEYGEYCNTLLQDDAMLFITVKSAEAEHVPKVLQVVEETKRIRYKAGLSDEEELHQYVLYDTQEQKKGPRRINLDDDPKDKYAPPKNLTVHLSKIPLPELQPKGHVKEKSTKDSKKKEDKMAVTSKSASPAPQPPTLSTPTSSAPAPPSKAPNNKLHRPNQNSSPNSRVRAHQVHPSQPSPSPSQLNNPAIYVAPPPNKRPASQSFSSNNAPLSVPKPPDFPQPHIPNFGGPPYGDQHESYTRHSPAVHSSPYPGPSSSFPPPSWEAPPGPPPSHPPIYQPKPVNANQAPSTQPGSKPPNGTGSLGQGASIVVQGLMDKLTHRR